MDELISRPRSMEGPLDSGVSISGDTTGSSPESDNSSQHAQNQSVSIGISLVVYYPRNVIKHSHSDSHLSLLFHFNLINL